jgi:hypothetical protein
MDKQIFDLPLTLRVEVPKAWKEATAMGDGKQLPVRIRDGPNGSVVLVDVPSQTTAVRVARRP